MGRFNFTPAFRRLGRTISKHRPAIMVGIGIRACAQVVGDVVVRVEVKTGIDAAVHQFGHALVEISRAAVVQSHQVGLCDHRANVEMHMAFGLHDARQDAVEVFVGLLFVMAVFLG